MRNFTYTAYDGAGTRRQGELVAGSRESAKFKLKERGLVPVEINREGGAADRVNKLFQFNRRASLADVEILTSQLSLLLKNGVKVDRALENVGKGIKNSQLKKIVGQVCDEIKRGVSLSRALEKNPTVFDSLYVSVVRIGEATGKLAEIFAKLAANLSFRQKVSAA
ncbi:MAG: hypothetical protein DRH03_11420, partial [Deltaproteobacteria bacterium]